MFSMFLALVVLGGFTVALYLFFFKKAPTADLNAVTDVNQYTIEYLSEDIQNTFDNILKTNYAELNMNAYETEKAEMNKSKLRKNLKLGKFGNLGAKYFVRDYIVDLLQKKYRVTPENVNLIIPFNEPQNLTSMEKYDILLYLYEKAFKLEALNELIKRNNLAQALPSESGSGDIHYEINRRMIEQTYNKHMEALKKLTFTDMLNIVAQRIYQGTYGNGVIDETRDMNIDGVNCGTSGIPDTFYQYGQDLSFGAPKGDLPLASYNAIWVMYDGKKIHFSFMGFESQAELERVARNIYRYNDPGTLSMSHPYMVSESQDGCRIVVLRPKMVASWCFFIRKFKVGSKMPLETLYPYAGIDKFKSLARLLILGNRNIALTGQQATGKSTCMMSLCQFIRESYSIRTQEKAFELNLQKIYKKRNIVAFRETDDVPGQVGLNIQKKSDGDVNLVGEVAEAEVASWAVQTGQKGSAQTIFTHHAKTAYDLVTSFRDDIIKADKFNNEKIVERTVAQVLNFNIHIARDVAGKRYIERVTEIIPAKPRPYPTDPEEAMKEYFYRQTDRQTFECINVLEGNPEEGFKFVGVISEEAQIEIKKSLTLEERADFEDLILRMTEECRINNPGFFGDELPNEDDTDEDMKFIDLNELNDLTELTEEESNFGMSDLIRGLAYE